MSGNSFGRIFRVTTFGESHGKATGGVIDGCPAGLYIDMDFIQSELDRRRPGQSSLTTARNEDDKVEFISGLFEGKTTGAPLAFLIRNKDHKPEDYSEYKNLFRPSHADYTYSIKYGHRDYRGGGRASARETAARVVAGAVAKLWLAKYEIKITGYVSRIGTVSLKKRYYELDLSQTEKSIVRCPDTKVSHEMTALLEKIKAAGDTTGGIVSCVATGVPAGLGEPVFDKLQANLAKAMLSINAAKGFEYGEGFHAAQMKGSEHNDIFIKKNGKITTETNRSGGIQGGISNGEDIYFNVAFKPVATLMRDQQTVDKNGNKVMMKGKGRHDVCVVPRAVPIVEAMAAIILTDHLLLAKSQNIFKQLIT